MTLRTCLAHSRANDHVAHGDLSQMPHSRILDTPTLLGLQHMVHDSSPKRRRRDFGALDVPRDRVGADLDSGHRAGLQRHFAGFVPREVCEEIAQRVWVEQLDEVVGKSGLFRGGGRGASGQAADGSRARGVGRGRSGGLGSSVGGCMRHCPV